MPRILFITKGEYAGRYMRLEDDMAERALADGWARETEQEPEADPDNPNPVEDLSVEQPDSLEEFENPDPEATDDDTSEASDSETGEPQQPKRRSTKSPQRRRSSR